MEKEEFNIICNDELIEELNDSKIQLIKLKRQMQKLNKAYRDQFGLSAVTVTGLGITYAYTNNDLVFVSLCALLSLYTYNFYKISKKADELSIEYNKTSLDNIVLKKELTKRDITL